jgi:hypothetical protein
MLGVVVLPDGVDKRVCRRVRKSVQSTPNTDTSASKSVTHARTSKANSASTSRSEIGSAGSPPMYRVTGSLPALLVYGW